MPAASDRYLVFSLDEVQAFGRFIRSAIGGIFNASIPLFFYILAIFVVLWVFRKIFL